MTVYSNPERASLRKLKYGFLDTITIQAGKYINFPLGGHPF